MSAILLDTVGLVPLWNRSDQWHTVATRAFQEVVSRGNTMLTTSFVLLECGNAAARWPFRRDVTLLREQLETRGLLVFPTDEDWRQGWEAFEQGHADRAGIVDQVSFVVMRRLGVTQAFTNDRHFSAAGFPTLF